MGTKNYNTLIGIEEMISIAKENKMTNITLQNLNNDIINELKNRGYNVYSCEKSRIGGHLKFIHLTMIEWKLEDTE